MPYPHQERLRNLEKNVAEWGDPNFYDAPAEDVIWAGVVSSITSYSGGGGDYAYLNVALTDPTVDTLGNVVFFTSDNLLDNVHTSSSRIVRVYVYNVKPSEVSENYSEGDAVSFWRYTGRGDNAKKIRGTYLTLYEEAGVKTQYATQTGTWSPGTNYLTITPCKGPSDSTSTGDPNVIAYIQFPLNKPAVCFGGQTNDILGYQVLTGGVIMLVSPPYLPRPTLQFQGLYNQSSDATQPNYTPDMLKLHL